ncbi:conserved Plasmodium protein, unknown function [Plasmodium gallinaceum]|uniref:WD repeat-containing protein n=1 Tax=Plasmodium gallinaceum TaxID=5849 RepID=A0A1J1GQ78_PLAGA|nr:conserved Plasmodium protein, unknown function [Plasmodium gallinaceum]CRG94422.1 conserved Plasmodium protein, unknown function [Plasmodium gallinaceum]
MQIITSDKIGLLQYIQCKTKSSINEQNLEADLKRRINHITWSGGYGGYEESEITLCRSNGLVESFEFYQNEENPYIDDTPSLSFITCNNCIYTKMLNHHHNLIYDDLLNKNKKMYTNYLNFMPNYENEKIDGIYEDYLLNDRLLVTVSNTGHVQILNWKNDSSLKYHLDKTEEMKNKNDKKKKVELYFKNYKRDVLDKIHFKIIEDKDNNIIMSENEYKNIIMENICKEYHYNNMISKKSILQSYILSKPIDAVCVNELLTNRLAIGGYKNCLKVFDLFTGKYLWKSKGLGMSLLNLNCETLIKSINFLNDINVNILCAGTYNHKIILYDIRCQNKPVYIYDHYKNKNVTKDKYNYFNDNYYESDLVFTSICSNSYIINEQYKNTNENSHKIKNEEKKENIKEKKEKNEYITEDLYLKFNTHELALKNLEILKRLQKERNVQKEKKKIKIKKDKKVEKKSVEKLMKGEYDNNYFLKVKKNGINKKKKINKKEEEEEEENKNSNKKIKNEDIIIYRKKENLKYYFIKKFANKDSQIIFVSDNYGNVYQFEIATGNKLLNYIYIKKCAEKNIKYKKKSNNYLIKNREKLYAFYKDYQQKNKTHMRNDLPPMWAKKNFDQFLITLVKKFKIHNGAISSLSLHKEGKVLCSVSYERFLSILNIESKKIIKRIHVGHILTNCMFHSQCFNENQDETKQIEEYECESWENSSTFSDDYFNENEKNKKKNLKCEMVKKNILNDEELFDGELFDEEKEESNHFEYSD